MPLKYQKEIDLLGMSISCPVDVIPPSNDVDSYRFSYTPINHQLNFLPNVVFDKLANIPFNYKKASDEMKCIRCGASFYTSLKEAIQSWNNLSEQNRENLGYTHVANGKLVNTDGLVGKTNKYGHFGFYENETAKLTQKFVLVSEL